MFYKQFFKIIDAFDKKMVEEFDFWLGTLPEYSAKCISVSNVAARFEVSYTIAEILINFACQEDILAKEYMVLCGNEECEMPYGKIMPGDINEILGKSLYCHECDSTFIVELSNIIIVYRRQRKPNVSDAEIKMKILERLGFAKGSPGVEENFNKADSLENHINEVYSLFYAPDESAFDNFKKLRDKLDLDYGKNTTAKGSALESLVIEIFSKINGVRATSDIKTRTNQFDCTCLCGIRTAFPSIFTYLAPYFIIECKNEPKTKPDNNYCNKLLSIMETNEAQIGIIFGRENATSTCFNISREHYLKHSESRRQQIVITCSDVDLEYLIDKKVNLLEYLEYKLLQVTANTPKAAYEIFGTSY